MRTTPEADTRDIARGAGVNYVGYIARLGSRVPFIFLAGLLYGEARFGVFTFALTVVETSAALATLGIKRSLYKFMSEEMAREGSVYHSISAGVTLTVTVALTTGAVVALGADWLASAFHLPSAAGSLRMMSIAIPMIGASEILLTVIRFTRQMRFDVYARSLAEPMTLTVAIAVLWFAGVRDLGLALGYTASLTVAALLSAVFFVRVFQVRRCLATRPRWAEVREILAFSAPTAGYDLLQLLADRVDVLLVSYLMPASAVGVYGMAKQFATPTKKIRMGFDRILQPVLSDSLAGGGRDRAARQLALVGRWVLIVEVAVVLFFLFWGDDLLGLMRGGFGTGAAALVLLVTADLINGSLGVSELPFVFLRPVVNTGIGILMLILALVLNAGLIPILGLVGAALATVVTMCVVNAVRIYLNWRLFGISTVSRAAWKPFAAAVPAAGAVLTLQWLGLGTLPLNMVVGVPVLAATYLAALALLGLEPDDRELVDRIRSALRRPAGGPVEGGEDGV